MSSDSSASAPLTYRSAGVDIDSGDQLVSNIKPHVASTRRAGADGEIGGFGGLFDLKAAGFKDPILVGATDGVGTKLEVAIAAGTHDTVGIDLVAMCVNDLIVQGAEPLFFLDYMATGTLDVDQMTAVVAGIADGCRQAGAALIGGETAEMPGMYSGKTYDLAGFAVGAAERGTLLPSSDIKEGDCLIGITSSGPHSNGYSLIRKIVSNGRYDISAPAPFDAGQTLGQALLAPTRIYVKSCLKAVRSGYVKAMAHITGGGFLENIPRVLPKHLSAHVSADASPLPPVFNWLMEAGPVERREMARTFNCGIGMVLVCAPTEKDDLIKCLEEAGETALHIGTLEAREDGAPACVVSGSAGSWGADSAWTTDTRGAA